jgi:hypothetical protein
MAPTTAFRALVLSLWLLPLAIVVADLALFMATPHATMLVARPYREWDFVREQVLMWSSILIAVAGVVASAGLWAFRQWAVPVFVAAALAYSALVAASGFATYSGLHQMALFVQGAIVGAVVAWLILARHTLPFGKAVAA